MNTTRDSRAARPPRPRPARSIRLLETPAPEHDGWGAVEITVGRQTDTYLVRPVPADFENATGYEVEKLDSRLATVESYHVLVNGSTSSCECMGFLRWGHCKHLDGLRALQHAGLLPHDAPPIARTGPRRGLDALDSPGAVEGQPDDPGECQDAATGIPPCRDWSGIEADFA